MWHSIALRSHSRFGRFAFLIVLIFPLSATAGTWQLQVGAQSDKTHQALAFLAGSVRLLRYHCCTSRPSR